MWAWDVPRVFVLLEQVALFVVFVLLGQVVLLPFVAVSSAVLCADETAVVFVFGLG